MEEIIKNVRASIRKMIELLLREELTCHIKAMDHQRTEERKDYRNGYFYVKLRIGALGVINNIRIPRCRNKSFIKKTLKIYRKNYLVLNDEIIRAHIFGLEYANVKSALWGCFGTNFERRSITKAASVLMDDIAIAKNRTIFKKYKYLFLESVWMIHDKESADNLKPLFVVLGVDFHQNQDVISISLMENETADHWERLLEGLIKRGLDTKPIRMITYGGIFELGKVVERLFEGAAVQRCLNSKLARILDARNFKKIKHLKRIGSELATIFNKKSQDDIRSRMEIFEMKWRLREGRIVQLAREDGEGILNYFKAPEEHRALLKTTAIVRPVIDEISKTTRAVACYQNIGSRKDDFINKE